MSVLDGLHVDQCSNDVLPAIARLQQADFRWRGLHLHARLGKYGRLHNHPIYPYIRPLGHHHRLHLLLHFLNDETIEIRCTDPRQRIRHSSVGKSEQSQSHHVLRLGDDLLGRLGPLCRPQDLRRC